MSYKIGQVRRSSTQSPPYLQDVSYIRTTVWNAGIDSQSFPNFAIQPTSGAFDPQKAYYLRFTLQRLNSNDSRFTEYVEDNSTKADPRTLRFKLQLSDHDGSETQGEYEVDKYQVIDDLIVVDYYEEGVNTQFFSYETVFVPNSAFKFLGFVLERTRYDYLRKKTQKPREEDIENNIDLGQWKQDPTNDRGDLCTITNILPVTTATKIGIQSRPGLLACVNKEPIRVGRTGTYQVTNGTPITFVGIVSPNASTQNLNTDPFILDYAYDG